MPDSLLKLELRSHPGHPPPPGLALSVERLPADDPQRPLRLRYRLDGPVGVLRWPVPLAADAEARQDGLWKHTCFEAFVAAADAAAAGYVEYNCAPSGAWAAYRFDGYRSGMRAEPLAVPPRVAQRRGAQHAAVDVALPWPAPPPGDGAARAVPARVRLGLTAVVEAMDGSLSYWALRHPPGRPDFHNAAGFQLELEVAG